MIAWLRYYQIHHRWVHQWFPQMITWIQHHQIHHQWVHSITCLPYIESVKENQFKNEFNFIGFETYLKVTHNKNHDATMGIIRDIKIYLSETERTDETDDKKLLNIKQLEAFLRNMKETKLYKPTTRAKNCGD